MTPLIENATNSPDTPCDIIPHQNLVCAFLTSGLSQKAFCAQHALKESTFKNWVYRYQKSRLDQTPPDSLEDMPPEPIATVDSSSLFVPVRVTHDECQEASMPEQPSRCAFKSLPVPPPSPLRLETGSFCITIPVGFDGDTLRSVLSIVQAYP